MWTQSVAVQRVEEPVVAINDVLMVSEAKAAKLLGVSRRTVFALNKQGVLLARRVGKRKLYSVESLKNFSELEVA
jgi:excisionase family DNA binding protein